MFLLLSMYLCINDSMHLSIYLSTYLPIYLSIYACMYAFMHACTVSIVVPSCSYFYLFSIQCLFFSSSVCFFLPIGISMLGNCPLWTRFEQVTWGTLFLSQQRVSRSLVATWNNSTSLNKRPINNLKPSGRLQIYLSYLILSYLIFLLVYLS